MASAEDESRYGQMCLLVLHIAPDVLRQVVDHQCTVACYRDFEDALNSKIHTLFHLRFRKCCCGSGNTLTPLSEPQWNLLYCRVPTATCISAANCRHSYQAIPGVTSGVMDLTLCCLILSNLFSSMSMTDVITMQTAHNDLLHVDNASLDHTTFQRAWSAVSQALLNLAGSVSTTCLNDTIAALRKLKERIVDPTESKVLADIMRDNRNYLALNDNINRLQALQLSNEDEMQTNTRRILELQSQLLQTEIQQRSHESTVQRIIDNEGQKNKRKYSELPLQVLKEEKRRRLHETNQRITTDNLTSSLQQQEVIVAEIQRATMPQQPGMTPEGKDRLRQDLLQNYHKDLECISITQLDYRDLTLDQMYTPFIVEEDLIKRAKIRLKTGNGHFKEYEEVFYKSGKLVERVFMRGVAGRGKTMFVMKLVHDWCNIQKGLEGRDMRKPLSLFEFTFFVSLRHVKQGITNIVDMVCDSLPSKHIEVITNILSDENICCLIILDGLDEWSCPSHYDNKFPDSRDLNNCILFTTTRPWTLEKLRLKYSSLDKFVEIQGIHPECIKKMIKHVVTYLYDEHETDEDKHETDKDSVGEAICRTTSDVDCENVHETDIENPTLYVKDSNTSSDSESDENVQRRLPKAFRRQLKIYIKKLQAPSLKTLMSIPLMLTASCHVWYENYRKKQGEDNNVMTSMTYFSLAIIDILTKRAKIKDKDIKSYLKSRRHKQRSTGSSTTTTMTTLLSRFFPNIVDHFDILMPFCKLAYQGLLANEKKLVFEKAVLEREMGDTTVDLALKMGFIRQCKAPGSFHVQNVSVSFFHKLIQEIMAAMYITDNPDFLQKFCFHCNSINEILNLSNVVMFLTGLDSSQGCQLLQHIRHVAQTDRGISLWRQTLEWAHDDEVRALYRSQCECYNEMVHVTTMMHVPRPPPYHVTDVYVDESDSDAVKVTEEFMSNTHHTVVSVYLWRASDISRIIEYLPQHSTSLTALGIVWCDTQSCELLATIVPQLTHLQCIQIWGRYINDGVGIVAALAELTRLKSVELWHINLSNITLSVSHMTQLERLSLWWVDMSGNSWGEFLTSLLSVQHNGKLHVTLWYSNIGTDSVAMILSSSQFSILKHETFGGGGTYHLEFCREA